MTDLELVIKYAELLQETLCLAEGYQDWTDMHGKSRYKASEGLLNLKRFEVEHRNRLLSLGLYSHVL